MAKLKYDRPINIDSGSDRNITIPNDEVWKVTTREGDVPASPKLYGGVHIQLWDCFRHRLQAHRRVSDAVEVMLHG